MKISLLIKQCLTFILLTHITFCSDKKVTFSPQLMQLLQKEFRSIKEDLKKAERKLSSTGVGIDNLDRNVNLEHELLQGNQQELVLQTHRFIEKQDRQEVSIVMQGVINKVAYKEDRNKKKWIKNSIIYPAIDQSVDTSIAKEFAVTPVQSAMKSRAKTQQQVIDSLEQAKELLKAQQKAALDTELARMNAVIDAKEKEEKLIKKQKRAEKKARSKDRKKALKAPEPSYYDSCCIS